MKRNRRKLTLVGVVAAMVLAYVGNRFGLLDSGARPSGPAGHAMVSGSAAIAEAHRLRQSGVLVELAGEIKKVLPDDLDAPRHQRFILQLSSGMTVLVAHNIDLAPRVPAEAGDALQCSGQYEWNDQGGVVHWTHHDPRQRRPGGWIEHRGQRYQ